MTDQPSRPQRYIELVLPWFTISILLIYTYAIFFEIPYVGFDFNPGTGEVIDVFIGVDPETGLQRNDTLLQIGALSWEEFRQDANQIFFADIEPGQTVPIKIQRGGQIQTVSWLIPGLNQVEFLERLVNIWWLAYIFWIAGTVTLIFVRPRDSRRALLGGAFYLTAIWLITGNISAWQVWHSAIVMRMAIWLCVPVYLHLHWVFPSPFRKLPGWLLWGGYGLALGFALAEWLRLWDRNLYFLGFLLAVVGTIVLLTLHFIRQPQERQTIGLLMTAAGIAFLPAMVLSILGLMGAYPRIGAIGLLALPALPGAYFYAAYRRQLGDLELRANRLISVYLFLTLLGTLFFVLISFISAWYQPPLEVILIFTGLTIAVALLSILAFPLFSRFVELKILGMPLPPTKLIDTYSSQIATSLDTDNLAYLLRDEILPSLLVRKSILLQFTDQSKAVPVYWAGVDQDQIPSAAELTTIVSLTRSDPRLDEKMISASGSTWMRLAFPLNVEDQLLGAWLLGGRDPDDFYAQSEITVLQTLAYQVALALVNIAQAERLRAIFEANVERVEEERTALARVLHDEVLNQLAILATQRETQTSAFIRAEEYQAITDRIRRMISGLRPAMLTYGLSAALDELVDDLCERAADRLTFDVDIQSSPVRYPPRVEEHLYRIIQQVCENAMQHAEASAIRIYGQWEPDIILAIEDDGVGFPNQTWPDIRELLAQKHYGLVGLMERADIIGAQVEIDSRPQKGTKVLITWKAGPEKNTA